MSHLIGVIGVGSFGSALIETLLKTEKVIVFNRAIEESQIYQPKGALTANSVQDLLQQSSIIFVCVKNYSITKQILFPPLQEVQYDLHNKIIIHLSSKKLYDIREFEALTRRVGGRLLNTVICGSPLHVPAQLGGAQQLRILISGSKELYDSIKELLAKLGNCTFVGEDIGAANVLEAGALGVHHGILLGYLHGAAMCEKEGLPASAWYNHQCEVVPSYVLELFKSVHTRITANNYAVERHKFSVENVRQKLHELTEHAEARGVSAVVPRLYEEIFRSAEQEYKGEDFLAVYKSLLQPKQNTAMEVLSDVVADSSSAGPNLRYSKHSRMFDFLLGFGVSTLTVLTFSLLARKFQTST